MTPRRGLLPHLAVAALLLIAVIFQIRFDYDSIDAMLHITAQARAPFSVAAPQGTLNHLQPEAMDAGIAEGDRPNLIDGREVRGPAGVAEVLHAHRPGETIQVTVSRNGAPVGASVRLTPESDKPVSVRNWILTSFLNYLTPWFCLLLGFGVAFVRPRDPLAWLLLLLLLSFGEVAQGEAFAATLAAWERPTRSVAMFYYSALNDTWGLWMMLFGQYFPDRVANRFWDRLTRWALGLPLAVSALLLAIVKVAEIEDATALATLHTVLERLAPTLGIMTMIAISTFFINIFTKMAYAKAPDARRRLKLLYSGASASLTPIFLVVVATLIMRTDFSHIPDWILVPALTLLFLFPVTLAYVIVVEKAMELRVVVRQGLQYALARRGLRVLITITISVLLAFTLRMITQPGARRPQQIVFLGLAVVIVLSMRQAGEQLRAWIDRRFFREAVNVEQVLSDLSEKVRTIVEVQPLLATVTNTISSTLHVPRVAALIRQNGSFAPAHAHGFGSPPLVKFSAKSLVAARLERSREPVRVSLARTDSWIDGQMDSQEEKAQLDTLGTELLLPLAVKDRLLGFLSVGAKLSEEPYSPTDVRLLQSVAAQTGLALENSRLTEAVASEVAQRERMNRELEIAREVQQRLFPQAGPRIPGLDYSGKCRPASSVGGDYYDFVPMCDGRLGIAIGDISGKGVPAALLMASLQASLRGLAIANPAALSTLMVNLNRLIYDASPSNRYATFFYGVYDPKSREFMYVNGGHNPPMVFRGVEVLRLEEGGPVVGLFGPAQYTQASIVLNPGDTMVLFTDGVSEAMNAADEEFDEERLINAVRTGTGLAADDLIDHIIVACDKFVAGAPQHDDMTLVVVRVE